jgi:ferredoxin
VAKAKRKIIKIDEEKCDGCGLCIPSCPEGALQIVGGKAKLVKESFCDGLGACLGECPQGALVVEEKEVDEYDEEGVIAHVKEKSPELLEQHLKHLQAHAHELPEHHSHAGISSCPSARVLHWEKQGREKSNPERGLTLNFVNGRYSFIWFHRMPRISRMRI